MSMGFFAAGAMGQGGGGGGGDPYWANVKSLLNMGGADGSTSFPDSASARVWTPTGNVQIDDSLGYNTALFDGSGDRLTTPYVSADFDWWPSDYTIEAWIYITTLSTWYYTTGGNIIPAMVGCANPTSDINYWCFGPIDGGAVRFYYYNGAPVVSATSSATVSAGVLTHIAMSKNGSGIHLGVNGVVPSPIAISGTPQSSVAVPLTLGQINNRSISGRIRALRITKGTARYTSNFTPPPAPFPTS